MLSMMMPAKGCCAPRVCEESTTAYLNRTFSSETVNTASTVHVIQATLYGMLKSGSGSCTSEAKLCTCATVGHWLSRSAQTAAPRQHALSAIRHTKYLCGCCSIASRGAASLCFLMPAVSHASTPSTSIAAAGIVRPLHADEVAVRQVSAALHECCTSVLSASAPHLEASGGKLNTDDKRLVKLTDT